MKKGFTLIELLVVISIIVVLASIVLVGVRSAINKAKDARIVSGMSQLQTQAEMFRQEHMDSYTGFGCASNTSTVTICTDITRQGGLVVTTTESVPYTSAFCAYVSLTTQYNGVNDYYCIDSNGTKGQVTSSDPLQAATAVCDTNFICSARVR
ncbi:MAG: type II secretion system protein [Candidatus Paceibacterota bacterium]